MITTEERHKSNIKVMREASNLIQDFKNQWTEGFRNNQYDSDVPEENAMRELTYRVLTKLECAIMQTEKELDNEISNHS